jgi:hypothetical protein
LRNDYEVFNTSDYDYGLSGKQKRINLNHPDMNVAVLGNFATSSASVVPAFQETGTWYEYFSGDSLQVSDVNAQITLEPGEYRLYTDKELETPEFILGMENQGWDQEGFGVMVYPNPSQQDCNILISSPQPLPVTILINDITGKELRKLATGITVNGTQIFTWDGTTEEGTETSAGIYLLQILTPLNQRVIKVIR